jgi:hypothetical protein
LWRTVSTADLVVPPYAPEIATLVLLDTVFVITLKVALVLPPGTVTLDGTAATDVLLLTSLTTAPPEGALALSVTVPVELLPPIKLVGFRVSEERLTDAGVMVREAWAELDPRVAVIPAVVVALTACVLIPNLALVAPAATVTLAGTLAAELVLDRLTAVPPDGAGALKVTVP